jgi:hypothetical protein
VTGRGLRGRDPRYAGSAPAGQMRSAAADAQAAPTAIVEEIRAANRLQTGLTDSAGVPKAAPPRTPSSPKLTRAARTRNSPESIVSAGEISLPVGDGSSPRMMIGK